MSEKISLKKYNKSPLRLIVEHKQADVITGANLFISLADARAFYKLTSLKINGNDVHDVNEIGEVCRGILRKISKSILLSKGVCTDEDVLLDKFDNL